MRWFKHMSNAAQDERLALLQAEFGLEGYGFFWRVLEIIALQMDEGERSFCHYPEKVWRKFLGISPKNFQKLLDFCVARQIFMVENAPGGIRISSSNLLKYRDEWSRKKARHSGDASGALQRKEQNTNSIGEEMGKVQSGPAVFSDSNVMPGGVTGRGGIYARPDGGFCGTHPQWAAFFSCWRVYPVQQGQEEAWREWFRLHGARVLPEPWEVRDSILSMSAQDSRWRRGKVPRMARWLNGLGWRDKPFVESRPAPRPAPHPAPHFEDGAGNRFQVPPGQIGQGRVPQADEALNSRGRASEKGPSYAPTPKTYAQAQDFERRQRAVNLLQEMNGENHGEYCDHTARIEEARGALPKADTGTGDNPAGAYLG